MNKLIAIFVTSVFLSFSAMADIPHTYSGEIIVATVVIDNENTQDQMMNAAYDKTIEKSPVDLLSSYGKVSNAKKIRFSNLKENETVTLSGEEGNVNELLVQVSLYKNKEYNVNFEIHNYQNGSNTSFSQMIKEIKPQYIALNGIIMELNDELMTNTIAFVKFD